PNEAHTIYVFAHANFDIDNSVTVTGHFLSGSVQTITFDQTVEKDGLKVNKVNDGQALDDDLQTYAIETYSDNTGHITISVTNAPNAKYAIAGLAIAPERRAVSTGDGSISGEKWNDLDGDKIKDPTEPGLAGWTVYVDENNNGKLDTI